ncbi:MAG TPA: DUF58 domain-containing protein [Phycisphaerae bacterium]|nr:DUF58 domain-containing protein [Phycisphaerae bacterium]HRR83772.1 DUF58 domain-containing protein [Phycisphaerae bacterium]
MTALADRCILLEPQHKRLDAPRAQTARRTLHFTFGGLLFAFVNVVVLLAGLNSEANLLVLLFGIGVGALLVNAVFPILMLRRIEVDRIAPEGVVADRPFAVAYRLRNRRKRLHARGLTVTEMRVNDRPARFPTVFVECLPPRQEKRVEALGQCPRRAHLVLTGIRVSCGYPFGLFACVLEAPSAGSLTVYPAMGRMRHDLWKKTAGGQSQSARTARERENPDEFVGVREYREGDNYHWIHWRRSARTGELVVREMLSPRQTRMIIILDPWPDAAGNTSRPQQDTDDHDGRAERLISAAATAACAALEQGHRVGLICRAAKPVVIAPTAGKVHRQRLLTELAGIGPGAQTSFDELVGRVHWSTGWNARCLLLSSHIRSVHQRVARIIGTRAETILVLSPDSEPFDLLFDLTHPGAPVRRRR